MAEVDTGRQHCPRCAQDVARASCRGAKVGAETLLLCGVCGGVTRAVMEQVQTPLLALYAGSWRYVATFDGWIALLALSIGGWILSFLPFVGDLASAGAKLSYLFSVIRATARGADELPHATDFVDWSDFLRSTARSLLAAGIALGPLALAGVATVADATAAPLTLLAAAWAVAYLPGAMIVASLNEGCLGGINPLPVIELVRRIPRDYALTAGVLLALAVPTALVSTLIALVRIPVPVVSTVVHLLLGAVALAGPLCMARILGLLLRARSHELSIDG